MFWDRDGDGQIFPWGVFFDFQEPGFSIPVSILIILIVNINVSYPTRMAYSWLPDPSFRVNVPNIHKAKHGSDCGTYDPEDLFRRRLRTFCKHDHNNDGALTVRELFNLMHGHRCAADPFGWGAAFFEWGTTWLLIQKDARVYKEDHRGDYDVTLHVCQRLT